MPTLLLRFPGRQYHATPWGHHVNEGLIEWPPSPWRILRALLATGYSALHWSEDFIPPVARSLIERLSSILPCYRLPPATGTHSRHFMPIGTLDRGREKTTLVFDTWAQVNVGELAVTWDIELTKAETAQLFELSAHVGYLGRSESWVIARLSETEGSLQPGEESRPCDEMLTPGPGWEQVSLMAPQPASIYSQWRQNTVANVLAALPIVDSKKIIEQREKAEAPYPLDLIACLQVTTSWLHCYGWGQPPGSRRVLYWRRIGALEPVAPKLYRSTIPALRVEAMLLSMATATGNDHSLPPLVRTLPQAERLHRALVKAASRRTTKPCMVLTGCDESGKPLTEPHRHAHLLPLDLDSDSRLEHFLIWAPMGLDETAQTAVRTVRQTFTKRMTTPLRLSLVGAGSLNEMRKLRSPYGNELSAILGPATGATEWLSITPFVPPRHMKKKGRNTLENQVAFELTSRGFPIPIEIGLVDPRETAGILQHRHYIRSRRHGPAAPVDCGFSLTLRFAEPVIGPLCLGYGSHFGLGLFTSKRT